MQQLGCCRLAKARLGSYVHDFNNIFGPEGLVMVESDPINFLVQPEFQNTPLVWQDIIESSDAVTVEDDVN